MTTENLPAVARPRTDVKTFQALQAEFAKPERRSELTSLLGNEVIVDRFIQVALHAVSTDSNLLRDASVLSLFQSVKDAAMLGLEPTGLLGEGVITVYKGQAKFQPMWRGYLKLVRRSREVTGVDCQVVYAKDYFELHEGTSPRIEHSPVLPPVEDLGNVDYRGGFRGVYAWARYKDDPEHPIIEWMTVSQINEVRDQFSASVKAKRSSPWDTSWSEMARKTVIKRLAKRLPQSTVDLALMIDNAADLAEAAAVEPAEPAVRLAAVAAAQEAIAATTGTVVPPEPVEALEATEESVEDVAEQPSLGLEEMEDGRILDRDTGAISESAVQEMMDQQAAKDPLARYRS